MIKLLHKKVTLLFALSIISICTIAQSIPELLYYKFNGVGTNVPNMAQFPPPGTNNATLMGGLTQGSTGMCDGAVIGTGVTSTTDYVNTGWATNLNSASSWTISFWTKDITPSATLFYIFGDAAASSFRCFTNGVAGANNWILRGTGFTDVLIAGGATVAPHMCTYVYDHTIGQVRAYLDGVLVNTVAQGVFTFSSVGPFKVVGYSSNIGMPMNGLLDEFRLYSRALSTAEVQYLMASATASASPSNICEGSSTTLTANNALTYTWNPGNISGNGINVSPVTTTTYTVTGNELGCNSTATVTVNVNTLPTVTATATPGNTVVENTSVTLNGGGANTYTWSGPIGVTDNVPFNATMAAAGVYTVTGTDMNLCSNTATIALQVNPLAFSINTLIWGASPFQDSMWSVDTSTWSIVHRIAPSLPGFTITGITGMAYDPCEFKTYVILKLSGVAGRVLATINLPSGVCTQIGNLGTNISSITFRNDGQLYGVTGDGAIPSETLFLINKTDASKTLLYAMGNGADGEVICYNQADDHIYHWSGNGTVVYEKFSAGNITYTPTNIPTVGTAGGETFGALSLNPTTFIISNISSQFKHLSTSGVYCPTLINLPDDFRGLVMPPNYDTDKDSVCPKYDTVYATSAGAQWYTNYYSWGDGTIDTVVGNGLVSHIYQTSGTKMLHVLVWNGTCVVDTIW